MLPARGPAGHTAGHSLSRWPDSTRDHLPDPWQCGGSTPSSDCNARRAEPPNGKSDRLDQAENQIVIDCQVYDEKPSDSDLLGALGHRSEEHTSELQSPMYLV